MHSRHLAGLTLSLVMLLSGCGSSMRGTGRAGGGLWCQISSKSRTQRVGEPFMIEIEVENRGSRPVNVAVRGPSWVQGEELLEQATRSEESLRVEISRTEKRIEEAKATIAKATGIRERDHAQDLLTVAENTRTLLQREIETNTDTVRLAREILASALPLGSFGITDIATGHRCHADVSTLWCRTGIANAPMPPGMMRQFRCRMDSHWFFGRPGTYDFVFRVVRIAGESCEDACRSAPLRIRILPAPNLPLSP